MNVKAWLVFMSLLGALALGCDGESCPDEETADVNVAGTCAAGPTHATVHSAACFVNLMSDDRSLKLPTRGELDQARDPWRQGGWQLWGGLCTGAATCAPADFRRCSATRVGARLVLDCVDGTGASACRAELSESP